MHTKMCHYFIDLESSPCDTGIIPGLANTGYRKAACWSEGWLYVRAYPRSVRADAFRTGYL